MGLPSNEGVKNSEWLVTGGANEALTEDVTPSGSSLSRRDVIRRGSKLAFVVPVLMTFSAKDALAAGSNHSCYPAGHACPGAEPCCNGLACNNGVCGDPCVETGGLCYGDSDCCSGDCRLGVCQ